MKVKKIAISSNKEEKVVKTKFFDCVSKFIISKDTEEDIIELFERIPFNAPVIIKRERRI